MDVECRAVRERGFRFLGQEGIDLSAESLRVRSELDVEVDDSVIVSIRLPSQDSWIDAEAKVTDVEPSTNANLVGLRFRYIDPDTHSMLLDELLDELLTSV